MYKLCSLAAVGLVAGWLALATPATSQAQVSVTFGAGPGVYGGAYYRPGYYHHHHRPWVGAYYPAPVVVRPAYVAPPTYVAPPAYVVPPPPPVAAPVAPGTVVVPSQSYYPY